MGNADDRILIEGHGVQVFIGNPAVHRADPSLPTLVVHIVEVVVFADQVAAGGQHRAGVLLRWNSRAIMG